MLFVHQLQQLDAELFLGHCFFQQVRFLSQFQQFCPSEHEGSHVVLLLLFQHQTVALREKFQRLARSMHQVGSGLRIDFYHLAMFALQYESFP